MKFSKDAVIGLVVIGAVVILIWGINFLKGFNMLSSEKILYVKYKTVSGLKKSSSVTLRGLQIGQVRSIEFDGRSADDLIVAFSISRDIQLPKNTAARIISADIMGTKEIVLLRGDSKEILQSGDTIFGDAEGDLKDQVSRQMLPLKRKAEDLMANVDSVLATIQYVFNDKTRDNLRQSFKNINHTLQSLESTAGTLDTIVTGQKSHMVNIIGNIDSITGNLKDNAGNISNILTNFSSLSDSLSAVEISETLAHARQALQNANEVVDKINSGQGSIGMLINNDTLYMNLEAASNSLTNLLNDIQNNPKKYVRFSLFDTGKTVYVNSKKGNEDKLESYRIQIITSPTPIPLNDPVFKGRKNIAEIYYNGKYKYTIEDTRSYKEIIRKLKRIKSDFPDAFVVKIVPDES